MFNPQVTSSQMELLPLVCLCLLSWSGTTSADQHEPVVVKQDGDVILPCSINGSNFESGVFDWKKDGQTEVFMYNNHHHYNNGRTGQAEQFKGRVSHFQDELKNGNASIKITNAKMTDSGNYTCIFPNVHPSKIVQVELFVGRVLKDRTGENIPGAAAKPSVKTLLQAKDSALLQCEAHGVPHLEVHWQDSAGNILPAEKSQITESDRVYITLKTTVTKTDNFSCVATQMKFGHMISTETHVYIDGAASEPYVTILDQTQDGMLLRCTVRGVSPKPKIEWKDSSGKIVAAEEPQVTETGGSYDIILQTTVTKTDRYRCVVTQEEINHHSTADIYVPLNDHTVVIIIGVVIALLLLVVVVGVVLYKRKQNPNNDEKQPEENPMNQQNSKNQPDQEA